MVSPVSEIGPFETVGKDFKMEWSRFDGSDFRGWWSKLEQYFESELVSDQSKVRFIMLHLEGKALNWHHFFVYKQGGLQHLTWDIYAKDLHDRFGYSKLLDPMIELISHTHQGSMEKYNDAFVSFLNHIHLSKSYALSIFIKGLKRDIG